MKIRVIMGEEFAPISINSSDFRGKWIDFPEWMRMGPLHPNRIRDKVSYWCQMFFDADIDLTLTTYSLAVLDSVILWAVSNNHCDVVECIAVFNNGEKISSSLNKFGEYDESVRRVIDMSSNIKIKLTDLKIKKRESNDD